MSGEDKPTTERIAEAARDGQDEDEPLARQRRTEAPDTERLEPLLGEGDAGRFRERWETVQTGFVDEPRTAVEDADRLVAELMQRLAETFSEERDTLESQWSRGEDVSTEDLRIALQRYRSFFERLLAA